MKIFPKAKTANFVQKTVKDELLLYNLTTNKVLCLNQTSTDIYNLCSGTNDVTSIAEKTQLPKEVIEIAINNLSREGLLTEQIRFQTTRRDLLKHIALVTISMPLITTLVAPTAVNAQSILCTGLNDQLPGFFLGAFPSDTELGLTVCREPASSRCVSCRYSLGPGQSTCNNADCTTANCYCA